GALIRGGVRPYSTAMPAENSVGTGQPDTYAFEFLLRMHTLEGTEELAGMGHIEAGAVVAHEVGCRRRRLYANLDPSRLAAARELPSVLQQHIECGGQQSGIALGSDAVGNHNFNRAGGI